MLTLWVQLFCTLIFILIASQLFTNALAYFGQTIKISEGVTGSIFAAVATALPETMMPLLAILAGTTNEDINEQVSMGAILGAPLMLSTLSTLMMTFSVVKRRGFSGRISPEKYGFKRDLDFFLIAFSIAVAAMYLPYKPIYLRVFISFTLVSLYLGYVILTLKASKRSVQGGRSMQADEPLILTKFRLPNNLAIILLQMLVGLALLLFGAKQFINGLAAIAKTLEISALLISLLIIPIATELPEKVNSILWIRKNKDTLAFGNITGAMVFQGTLLPAIGILLTPWTPHFEMQIAVVITLLASTWLRLNASTQGLYIRSLMLNGGLYLIFLYMTVANY